jgi:hypothetical protein
LFSIARDVVARRALFQIGFFGSASISA